MVVLLGGAALLRAYKLLHLCAVLPTALQPPAGSSARFVAVTVLFCFADGGVAPATATVKLAAGRSSETL
jgi:hypothetical protein